MIVSENFWNVLTVILDLIKLWSRWKRVIQIWKVETIQIQNIRLFRQVLKKISRLSGAQETNIYFHLLFSSVKSHTFSYMGCPILTCLKNFPTCLLEFFKIHDPVALYMDLNYHLFLPMFYRNVWQADPQRFICTLTHKRLGKLKSPLFIWDPSPPPIRHFRVQNLHKWLQYSTIIHA